MCFHISLTKKQEDINDRFDAFFREESSYSPYFHLNGFSNALCYIICGEERYLIENATWGLRPINYNSSNLFNLNTLNAKSETVFKSPLFRKPILERRCLLIADGFFESKQVNGKKYPHYIHLPNNELFAFAGIYNYHKDGTFSCSLLTTKANDFMADIHNTKKRMPLILDQSFENDWLDKNLQEHQLQQLLMECFISDDFQAHPIKKEFNNSKIDTNKEGILEPFYYPELNSLF